MREPTDWEKKSRKYRKFHELDGYKTNKRRHLPELIKQHVQSNRLHQYARNQTVVVQQERPPSMTYIPDHDQGSRSRIIIP